MCRVGPYAHGCAGGPTAMMITMGDGRPALLECAAAVVATVPDACEGAADEFLAFKVDSVLSGRLRLDASAGALRRALTLDDASREAELPGAPSPRVPQSAAGACFTEL